MRKLVDHGVGAQVIVKIEGELHGPVGLRGKGAGIGNISLCIQGTERACQVEGDLSVIRSLESLEVIVRIIGENIFQNGQGAVDGGLLLKRLRAVIREFRGDIGADQDANAVSVFQSLCSFGEITVVDGFRRGVLGSRGNLPLLTSAGGGVP